MSTEQDTRSIFHKLVDRYAKDIGERPAEMMHEDFDAGEGVIAFERLLNVLEEMDIQVDASSKEDLHTVASAIGCLEHPAGRGKYW